MIRLKGYLTVRMALGVQDPASRGLVLLPAKGGRGKRWQRPGGQQQAPRTDRPAPNLSEGSDHLPARALQTVNSREELTAQATAAHRVQVEILNEGKGLDAKIGAKVVRLDQGKQPGAFEAALDQPGPVIVIGGLKSTAVGSRAEQKVTTKYAGQWNRLTDVVRATVAVDSMDELTKVVALLKSMGVHPVAKPDDRFATPTPGGYRDLSWNVAYNGHVSELQIHLKPLLKAKQMGGGHHLYEEARAIEAAHTDASTGKPDFAAMDAATRRRYDKLMSDMRDLYAAAWSAGNTPMAKAVARNPLPGYGESGGTMNGPKFFIMDGLPVRKQSDSHLPVDHTGALVDLWKFAHEARECSQAEHDTLAKELGGGGT